MVLELLKIDVREDVRAAIVTPKTNPTKPIQQSLVVD